MKRESKSLHFNKARWSICQLGERAILLQAPEGTVIKDIHLAVVIIQQKLGELLQDIVPAYDSIAIFGNLSIELVHKALDRQEFGFSDQKTEEKVIKLPICYELGTDLDRVAGQNSISIETAVSLHLQGVYTAAFFGFNPGFVYAEGLNRTLACDRLAEPRANVEAGSVGIGGDQTGIYSLAGPGGWNILGRTPAKLLSDAAEPILVPGMNYQFFRISENKFFSWGK